MIIYGASGHAKVIVDIAKSNGVPLDYILDDDREKLEILEYSVHHTFTPAMEDLEVVIAIGNNHTRKKVANHISNNFCKPMIHSSVILGENVKIGEGTVIMPNSVINSSATIGAHCIINTSAIIEHDTEINDFAHISPGATITGNVIIGEGTQIGAGATVIPGIKIGKWVTVGAGAVIIRDIPDFAVVVGNPGKLIKYKKIDDE